MNQLIASDFKDRNVCVLGLGYVGLTLAVAMADLGFNVHGIEIRDDILDGLCRGEPHFSEPRLKEKLERVTRQGLFKFSKTLDETVSASVYIITVGTPLTDAGVVQLASVENTARDVAAHAPRGALVILRSTVKLGTARNVIKPILDAANKDIQIAVCPERTLEGKALIELHELPQIIGADDANTRARCMQLFNIITRTTVAVRNIETAELIKLVDNTYRDVTFAFANEVAELCAHAGISAAEVIRAGRLGYPRTNVALPGPVGGPCLEKDPHILAESAGQWQVAMPISKAARAVNEAVPTRAVVQMRRWATGQSAFPSAPRISLMGLAFKGVPATDDLRGTMAKPIYNALLSAFPTATFSGYDPVVAPEAIDGHFGITVAGSLEEAFDGADIVVVMNNHPVFQHLELGSFARGMNRPALIYDFWNLYEDVQETLPHGVESLALGSEQAPAWC